MLALELSKIGGEIRDRDAPFLNWMWDVGAFGKFDHESKCKLIVDAFCVCECLCVFGVGDCLQGTLSL